MSVMTEQKLNSAKHWKLNDRMDVVQYDWTISILYIDVSFLLLDLIMNRDKYYVYKAKSHDYYIFP